MADFKWIRTGLLIGLLAASLCGGCAPPGAPRPRIGALPFPGRWTLYTPVDADRLGRHRYGSMPRLFQTDEKQRGIIYTTRAGFLDIAHLRATIDWTRYYTEHLHDAIKAGETKLSLAATNHARLNVELHYPPDWSDIPPLERKLLSHELALRSGQRLAYLTVTWHELITWFGHRNLFFVDESHSSFTYDDTMSHVLGLLVAERALRDGSRTFDDAVTVALADELAALGAVKPNQTTEAAYAVQGHWWANGKPLKRQFDIGARKPFVRPWLVRGLPFSSETDPEPFELPNLVDVMGRDATGFVTAEIDPRISQASQISAYLPGQPRRVRHSDVPALLAVVRTQMREKYGQDVNQPWPAKGEEEEDSDDATAGIMLSAPSAAIHASKAGMGSACSTPVSRTSNP